MFDLLGKLAASAPNLLELLGAVLIGAGVADRFGLYAALIWGGVACFGYSYVIESRRVRAERTEEHTS